MPMLAIPTHFAIATPTDHDTSEPNQDTLSSGVDQTHKRYLLTFPPSVDLINANRVDPDAELTIASSQPF